MNRAVVAIGKWLALLAIAAALTGQPAWAASRPDRTLEAEMMAHIQILASDEFQGREPGTEGEAKTLQYLASQWAGLGLLSGTNNPGSEWFVPVTLIERQPAASSAQFFRKGRRVYLPASDVLVLTSGARTLLRSAPVLFVGKGSGPVPARTELAGRIAVLLDGGIENSDRQNALLAGGASAVLTVLDGERKLENVAARRKLPGYALASETTGGDLEVFVNKSAMDRMLQGTRQSVASLQQAAERPDFVPQLLDLTATLEATTRETTILTHNLIGKLPGKKPDSGALLFVAHWDHFGVCAPPQAEDTICHGAVDNASGLAALTELARRLVRGSRLDRDVYFLATTAEELGLLGAHAFAENPPLPLKQIVAAFNIDTIALAPAGSPLAIVGRGMTPLDADIEKVAKRAKRQIVDGDAANAYFRRQDGWALAQHDVPTVMVTSAYSDIPRLEAFYEGPYHRPADNLQRRIELGGAAEDVLFYVELARWFGNSKRVRFPAK
ncbi:MAG: M28 family peptidase [Novosphingobium sp.]